MSQEEYKEVKREFNKNLHDSLDRESDVYFKENEQILKLVSSFYADRNMMSDIGKKLAELGRRMEINDQKIKILVERANVL